MEPSAYVAFAIVVFGGTLVPLVAGCDAEAGALLPLPPPAPPPHAVSTMLIEITARIETFFFFFMVLVPTWLWDSKFEALVLDHVFLDFLEGFLEGFREALLEGFREVFPEDFLLRVTAFSGRSKNQLNQ
jgi:hypothetical protein